MEILQQIKQTRLDAIFVCVGGGGLIAGISEYIFFNFIYVKRVRPEIKIIGVNTIDSDSLTQSLISGKQFKLKKAGLFSDGTSVRVVGKECLRLCMKNVDDVILVNVRWFG